METCEEKKALSGSTCRCAPHVPAKVRRPGSIAALILVALAGTAASCPLKPKRQEPRPTAPELSSDLLRRRAAEALYIAAELGSSATDLLPSASGGLYCLNG